MPKPDFDTYLTECIAELGFAGEAAKAEGLYKINLGSALQQLGESKELTAIIARLKEMGTRYAGGREELLFYRTDPTSDLSFTIKPFYSAIQKLYRHNVLFNRAYPKPNPRGIRPPAALYEQVDDLLRSRLVCKYMDGPAFVCRELATHCSSLGIEHEIRDQSTDAGYYAWHFYFKVPVEISVKSDVGTRHVWVELQVTTQLAEAITALTHGLYQLRREGQWDGRDQGWKWDANSQHFRSAYIGHGLHLLEGMIQALRDDVLGIGAPPAGLQQPPPEVSTPTAVEHPQDKASTETAYEPPEVAVELPDSERQEEEGRKG